MREVAFISQNREKWMEYENILEGRTKKNSLDELSDIYTGLVNDLAFAQSYYPQSKTEQYLNHLCAVAYQSIYKRKRGHTSEIVSFYKYEVPQIIFKYRKYLYLAFIIFFVSALIGVVSARYDDQFVRSLLGDDYVEETLQNIESGNPVAIYKSGSNWGSFLGITFNNIYVSMKCFIYGIFAGIGTIYVLMSNAVMLGAFQYFFYQHSVLGESLRGIWIHGAMEIFSIVITAMAGLVMGSGIIFPGTFTMRESFKRSFTAGFKIFLSTVPFFIFAGILEGFITRYALEMPLIINIIIILGTLTFISWYYLLYPSRINNPQQPV